VTSDSVGTGRVPISAEGGIGLLQSPLRRGVRISSRVSRCSCVQIVEQFLLSPICLGQMIRILIIPALVPQASVLGGFAAANRPTSGPRVHHQVRRADHALRGCRVEAPGVQHRARFGASIRHNTIAIMIKRKDLAMAGPCSAPISAA